jgi:hypothetical protein
MNNSFTVPEPLILAAVDRAIRHRHTDVTPSWVVYAHLGFARRSGLARATRGMLDTLTAAGALERSRRNGIDVWHLTPLGRRRLRAAGTVELPESPQHAAWRSAGHLAEQEIERFTLAAREALAESLALIESSPPASSDALFEAAEHLRLLVRRLASASYCLHEWAEPSDARADIDNYEDPTDHTLDAKTLRFVRSRRHGRRSTGHWTTGPA